LLSHKAIVTGRSRHRKTPLHFAAWQGKPIAVQLLCDFAQNCIDQSDDSLKTPLILAAINGNRYVNSNFATRSDDWLPKHKM